MEKGALIYEGKAKWIYEVPGHEDKVWVSFKNSMTAFNGVKKEELEGKSRINSEITTFIFKFLKRKGIENHWVQTMSPTEMVCRKVEIIPLEVVVRNTLAGSTAKRLGIEEGTVLEKPLVEFYYKKDELNDPFLSDDHVLLLKLVSGLDELNEIKKRALEINSCLKTLFTSQGIDFVDFKIEFGRTPEGELLLADEISPDSCRLWDSQTQEKMDKDRFRRDLGNVMESYQEVLNRLKKIPLE